jgi:predicted unusual protein kinase regulating ubiquinone biosynthesis (AarF/ABC1/UbiB family)
MEGAFKVFIEKSGHLFLRNVKLILLTIKLLKGDSLQTISPALGELHGIPQKFGQHLTLYPIEVKSYFEELCANGGIENINIEKQLNLKGIEFNSQKLVAKASIGQVYLVSTNSMNLAVKVKYTKIEQKIKSDYKFIKSFLKFLIIFPIKTQSLKSYLDNIYIKLQEECDYIKERMAQEKASLAFSNKIEGIKVPQVYTNFSDKDIIVSEWIDGKPLYHFMGEAGEEERIKVFSLFFFFQISIIMRTLLVHADPHGGNFLVIPQDNVLVVLDYGCMVSLSIRQKDALIRLILGEYSGEHELYSDLIILGVSNHTLVEYENVLGDIVGIFLEPFYCNDYYDFENWRLQYKLNTLLSSRTWNKPLELPTNVLFIIRMFQGLYFLARDFNIKFNWYQGLRKLIEKEEKSNE